jgi:5-methylcytosine-specific restriction endonuclease McrA
MSHHALVLNASFEPLHIVSWQRAVQLLFQGKAEVVEESGFTVRTVSITFRLPAVLRLLHYIPLGKRKNIVRFSRANVLLRDRNRCQYCRKKFADKALTLDHVNPASLGGRKCWENIVASCRPCNEKKGDKTPDEAGMRLKKKPARPDWLPSASLTFGVSFMPDTWKLYLHTSLREEDP